MSQVTRHDILTAGDSQKLVTKVNDKIAKGGSPSATRSCCLVTSARRSRSLPRQRSGF